VALVGLCLGLAPGYPGFAGFDSGSGGADTFFLKGATFGFGSLGGETQFELVFFDDAFGFAADNEYAHEGDAEGEHETIGRAAQNAQRVEGEGGARESDGAGEEGRAPEK
jgi:hypothetical protein